MNSVDILSVNQLDPSVMALDLERLKWKLVKSKEADWDEDDFDFADIEYRKLLTLKKLYPNIDFVPNKLVDKLWHAHILDTKAYRADCDKIFGYFLDHYPYFGIYGEEDYKNLVETFEAGKILYEKHFGKYPQELDSSSRCKDHACHAPTTCACRTPGACK